MKSLVSLESFKKARSISVYMSMPQGEVMTTDIIKEALQEGKTVYVPHMLETGNQSGGVRKKKIDMVSLLSISDFQHCESNRDNWGIPSVIEASLGNRQWILDSTKSV